MQIFNIVEELEKERKKNKELKEEIEKLTTESTEWEERTYCWQDRAENLQIVLDKIKKLMINTPDTNYSNDYVILKNEIYKLLEEIE